jgi:hypothetical protein
LNAPNFVYSPDTVVFAPGSASMLPDHGVVKKQEEDEEEEQQQ